MGHSKEHRIALPDPLGKVSAILEHPADARALLVLAHGAGANMHHSFYQELCPRLAERKLASLRYNFPYTERGARFPDRAPTLVATVRAVAAAAGKLAPELPRIAGGKSMGGRMTSTAQADAALDDIRALVFLGFPLHTAKKIDTSRAEHLRAIEVPMLFVQGTRDSLARLDLIRKVCDELGAGATCEIIEGGDHSFKVLKRSGRTDAEALDEVADKVAAFAMRVCYT